LKELAPIGLTVYGRLEHTKKTVEALQKNTLAKESKLYIFSDGPKYGDEDKVKNMREYLKTIDGFKEVKIVERLENDRIENNRAGRKYLLEIYDKLIWMAEDVITAPGYLQFMNDALDFYAKSRMVVNISGYCPPINIDKNYKKDYFALPRFSAWGVGLMSKYYKVDTEIDKEIYFDILNNKTKVDDFNKKAGEEALNIMAMVEDGRIQAGDMQSTFWQVVDSKLTIYPIKSLVHNIGNDSSGVHMPTTNKWDVKELWDKTEDFEFSEDIEVDEHISNEHYNFYKLSNDKNKIENYAYYMQSINEQLENIPIEDELIVYGFGAAGRNFYYTHRDNRNIVSIIDQNKVDTKVDDIYIANIQSVNIKKNTTIVITVLKESEIDKLVKYLNMLDKNLKIIHI